MGRRPREENEALDVKGRDPRPQKQVKLLRDGLDYAGQDWSWRTFLEKLHFFIEFETAGDGLMWLEDGAHFLLHREIEASLEAWLGLRVCSIHEALEVLNFERGEERHWELVIYHHNSFVRGNPSKITEMIGSEMSLLSSEKDMTMPTVAYSAALKPLEVRLSLPESHSQSWEVTVASSVLTHPDIDDKECFHFQESVGAGSGMEESSLEEMFDDTERYSGHEMNSPLWWSQRSDFSSICTDDLSDMDSLSQISAYYW